jgi:hypothetical protein
MEASERLPWHGPQAFGDEPPRRGLDAQSGACVTVARGLEPDFRVEALLEVVPPEPERRLDDGDNDQTLPTGPSKESRRATSGHLPAGALGEPAPVRPNGRVLGPPVGEVMRLGQELPHISAGCDQLPLRLDPHRL